MKQHHKQNQQGFTIVELVIVIAVIAILAAVLIPTFTNMVSRSRYTAALQAAQNGLKEFGTDYMVQTQNGAIPDGILVESNGYCFVHFQGKLHELDGLGDADNFSANLTALKKTVDADELEKDYQLFSLNADAYQVVDAYLQSRQGTPKFASYAETVTNLDSALLFADMVGRVTVDGTVYVVGWYAHNLLQEGDVNVYYGQVLGQYGTGSAQGEFLVRPLIKNIIYLIPDGAGFGTYDMANALKKAYGTGVYGQATPITHDAIEGKTVDGLYLDDYMIATAGTAMANAYGSATDSAAAGTALLCGVKTNYVMVGLNPDFEPVANILELARLDGKSTGFVTTKCLVDATPSDGLSHSLKRADQDNSAYQKSVSQQILNSDADVVLCYGSDGGYYAKANTQQAPLHDDRAANHGYSIVSDLAEMNQAVEAGVTKMFSNFQINYTALNQTGEYNLTNSNYYLSSCAYNTDYQALHLLYDCDAKAGVDITLMDMAKAALTTLSTNINDQDGFCLVIEGGAIDNAAEGRNVREAVAEYLAFDEVFGYCVNWAMHRTDTIVVACPDHDSGGLYCPTTSNGAYELEDVLAGLHDGTIARNTKLAGAVSGHSPQNVPVWLYAPEAVRAEIIAALGLPADTATDKVRSGLFYDGTTINAAYSIQNSDIAHAVVAAAHLHTFAAATAELFVNANEYGTYNTETEVFTFANGETIKRNTDYWTDVSGNDHPFAIGTAIYPTNEASYTTYDSAHTVYSTPNTLGGKFYVPRCALQDMGYVQ